jgi:hypothetical protein
VAHENHCIVLEEQDFLGSNITVPVSEPPCPQRDIQSVSLREAETARAGEQAATEFEAQHDDGGVRVSQVYTPNNGNGADTEALDGVQASVPGDRSIELQEAIRNLRNLRLPNLIARPLPQPPNSPRTTPKKTLSLRIKHLLDLNPGFCPGALLLRRKKIQNNLLSSTCTYCGLQIDTKYPRSYVSGYENYPRLSRAFLLESHVPVKSRDVSERRSCLICWEHEAVWVEPMGKEEWGKHVRRHFEEEGYWVCRGEGGGRDMVMRYQCRARKCKGVHG